MYQLSLHVTFLVITAVPSCSGSEHCRTSCCHSYPLPGKRYHCRWAVLTGEVCGQCWEGGWSHPLHTMYEKSIVLFIFCLCMILTLTICGWLCSFFGASHFFLRNREDIKGELNPENNMA